MLGTGCGFESPPLRKHKRYVQGGKKDSASGQMNDVTKKIWFHTNVSGQIKNFNLRLLCADNFFKVEKFSVRRQFELGQN